MSFKDLGLRSELIEAVEAKGYTEPSPIQAKAIPAVLEQRDVLGGAQTGTGKTAAFSLPMLHLLSQTKFKMKRPRALVLTPTRELAAQVHQSIVDYGKELDIRSTVIFGGVGFQPQIKALRRGVSVVVATPGRLLDLCNRGDAILSNIEMLVLDEADRMLDMGFIHDIKKILKLLPEKRQNLFFSATYSKDVKKLADTILVNPVEVEVSARNSTADRVDQEAYRVGQKSKRATLSAMIKDLNWSQVLVFMRTKHGSNRLAKQLEIDGITAMAIHGNKSQSAREKALAEFKANRIRVLVATDIAARGLDIDSLPFVVNYELPNVPEDYVHRIGRTGRAGKAGKAISFVCESEESYLWGIERLLKKEMPLYYFDDAGERVEVDREEDRKRSRDRPKESGPAGGKPRGGGNRGRSGGGRGGPGGQRGSRPNRSQSRNKRPGNRSDESQRSTSEMPKKKAGVTRNVQQKSGAIASGDKPVPRRRNRGVRRP